MPRTSDEARLVTPPPEALLPSDCPPPPELEARQAVEWQAIVVRLGAAWLPREAHALLTAYCMIKVQLDDVHQALAAFGSSVPEDRAGWQRYREITLAWQANYSACQPGYKITDDAAVTRRPPLGWCRSAPPRQPPATVGRTMSNIIYSTPIRSSLPQERWRREADAAEARRAAVEAASRRRSQVAQELRQQSATTATERSVQAQLAALRSELAQQHEVMREAMVAYVVEEFAALRLELQRMLKRQVAEIERDFETKLAGLRMPRVRGTFAEAESYRQHDIVTRNGNSYIARKDQPGTLPGAGWQQLSMVGRTGSKGERGYSGERGPQGESGATFLCWKIDKRNYVAIPLMTNGKEGPRLYLRELFEQYHNETNQARERE